MTCKQCQGTVGRTELRYTRVDFTFHGDHDESRPTDAAVCCSLGCLLSYLRDQDGRENAALAARADEDTF